MFRRSLMGIVTLSACACSSVAPAAGGPEGRAHPRILVNAMLFDVPADGGAPLGSADRSRNVSLTKVDDLSLYDLAMRAGARHVAAPTALAADGAAARMSIPPSSSEDVDDTPFAGYRLDVTPHVDEHGRVHLDVDFDLAGKSARTTLVTEDKQIVVLSPDIVVKGRRVVLLVRPNVVRSDADLEAIRDDLAARARRERANASPGGDAAAQAAEPSLEAPSTR